MAAGCDPSSRRRSILRPATGERVAATHALILRGGRGRGRLHDERHAATAPQVVVGDADPDAQDGRVGVATARGGAAPLCVSKLPSPSRSHS